MRWWSRGFFRWFYPGLRVKRWIALAFLSLGASVIALFAAIGISPLRALDRACDAIRSIRNAPLTTLMILGIGGFAFALMRLVHSVARGVAPTTQEKASALLFRTRVLERGPRVVAVGGGTGLATLLRGLKQVTSNITAVVTVMDDGGSSGRLRDEIDVLPPGDIRNCILALAEDEARLATYFQHRFRVPEELAGHSLGNLVLVGLEQATGSFDRAIEAMSHFLSVRGRVLPSTLAKAHLIGIMEDGNRIEGESQISSDSRRIDRIALSTSPVKAYDAVIEALEQADLIVLGPGSLFTSLVPNLLVEGVSDAIASAKGEKVLVANLMTQPGETDGFTLSDHLRRLNEYVPVSCFDLLIVNSALPGDRILAGYRNELAEPVVDDVNQGAEYGLEVVRADLLGSARWEGKETVKHDPDKVARAIVKHTHSFSLVRPSDSTIP